jgi:hypothetical protein
MDAADESVPIQLSGDRVVDIDFTMINRTGIPDDAFTPANDVWDSDLTSPVSANGSVASSVPPPMPVPPKSV